MEGTGRVASGALAPREVGGGLGQGEVRHRPRPVGARGDTVDGLCLAVGRDCGFGTPALTRALRELRAPQGRGVPHCCPRKKAHTLTPPQIRTSTGSAPEGQQPGRRPRLGPSGSPKPHTPAPKVKGKTSPTPAHTPQAGRSEESPAGVWRAGRGTPPPKVCRQHFQAKSNYCLNLPRTLAVIHYTLRKRTVKFVERGIPRMLRPVAVVSVGPPWKSRKCM